MCMCVCVCVCVCVEAGTPARGKGAGGGEEREREREFRECWIHRMRISSGSWYCSKGTILSYLSKDSSKDSLIWCPWFRQAFLASKYVFVMCCLVLPIIYL